MTSRRSAVFAVPLMVALAWPSPSVADNWFLPKTTRYCSPNGEYCVKVKPRKIKSQLDYWATVQPEAVPRRQRACTAILSRKRLFGYFRKSRFDLLNDVAPVDVLVADSGEFIVTLDNWHLMGYGPATVVIYRADGSLVRSLGLDELLTRGDIAVLSRSVSSIHWRDHAEIDEHRGVLRLKIRSGSDHYCDDPEIEIGLNDGTVLGHVRERLPRPRTRVEVSAAEHGTRSTEQIPGCDVSPNEVVPLVTTELLKQGRQLVRPVYPELARVAGLSAIIPVDVAIGSDGHVYCVHTEVEDNLGFSHAALDAAREWLFEEASHQRVGRLTVRFMAWVGCSDAPD